MCLRAACGWGLSHSRCGVAVERSGCGATAQRTLLELRVPALHVHRAQPVVRGLLGRDPLAQRGHLIIFLGRARSLPQLEALQLGACVIPKTAQSQRMAENLEACRDPWCLDEGDMAVLAKLDQTENPSSRLCWKTDPLKHLDFE